MGLIKFQFNIRDKEIKQSFDTVYIDSNLVVVIGERKDWMIYNDRYRGYEKMFAFLVNYNGVEYGTTLGDQGLFGGIQCDTCGSSSRFKIFERQFEQQFE